MMIEVFWILNSFSITSISNGNLISGTGQGYGGYNDR